jgi:predicted dehydrogenase
MSRRNFLATSGTVLAGSAIINPVSELRAATADASARPAAAGKVKLAMVGTGSRGTSMWGSGLTQQYSDRIEFVGLCDMNPGRVEAGKEIIRANCPTYSDLANPMGAFEKMIRETKPDLLIVTTVDATHNEYIVRGMELGVNVITEKPMTTDEKKVQQILDAEKRTGKKTRVTFNYRYSPHRAKMWELLRAGEIGDLTSVDFHWYLDTRHGADYFRRWHRLVEKSGSLWVHKASHHFDLLNWWIDSDPETVYALGSLDFYGKNGKFRAENCRTCPHTAECQFYFQLERPAMSAAMQDAAGVRRPGGQAAQSFVSPYRRLYIDCEKYDGYLRDGCVFKNDINIFDKMAATIKYANGVQVSYSLTAYSPYEGYRIAFNGTKGRMDAWIQESNPTQDRDYDEIVLYKNFSRRQYIQVSNGSSGHGGGDNLLRDQIFIPNTPDPYKQCAGTRDGSFACLIGIAARNSIASGQPVKIADMTSLKPQAQKAYQRDILDM